MCASETGPPGILNRSTNSMPFSSLLSAFLLASGKLIFSSLYFHSLVLSLQHPDGLRIRIIFQLGIPGRPPIFHTINHSNRFYSNWIAVPQKTMEFWITMWHLPLDRKGLSLTVPVHDRIKWDIW